MMSKKNERGKCPFIKHKPCREDCVFYRKGVRFNERTETSIPVEECAFNIIADNLEAMHQRTYAMQKEVGETKSVIALKTLADLGKVSSAESERVAKKMLNLPTNDDLLIEE